MEFGQIALLLVFAAGFGVMSSFFKQPAIVGYLLAGLLMSSLGLLPDAPILESFGQIGVALLLFLLGLEMKLSELPTIGKAALFTGIGQIITTFSFGFIIALLLGFEIVSASYIAIALTFSSTIIIVKLLSEKKDLQSLYGRISVGFLLVQDFVAVVILMFLAGLGQSGGGAFDYLALFLKAAVLLSAVWFLSKKVLPGLVERFVATNSELIFLFSVAWALGIAFFVSEQLGFTIEIGGFLAGLSLSNSPEHLQIAARTRPLRDFFLTIFFVILGTKLGLSDQTLSIIPQAVIFSLFVLVGNPAIVMAVMGALGYKKRTGFMAGLTTAQISEFSLILVAMGLGLGHVTQGDVSLVTMVGVITMTLSTYLIMGSSRVFEAISPYIGFFERKRTKEGVYIKKTDYKGHIVLLGCDRSGFPIASYLKRKGIYKFVVVDFNPRVFTKLSSEGYNVIFGDIEDPEILDASGLEYAKLVISTTLDYKADLTALEYLKTKNSRANSIFTASEKRYGIKLYEKGATFVVVPESLAGDYVKHLLRVSFSSSGLVKMGKNHFNRLIAGR